MQNLNELVENSHYAIDHIDDVAARKLLKEIDAFVASQNMRINNPDLFEKIKKLVLQLKIVNFPNLSDEECADILRNNYLESFAIEVPMENRLTAKLFFIPEIPRDELRKKLQRALMQNQQKIGNLAVSQWIVEFEKMFPVSKRNLSASVDFAVSHPSAKTLSPTEKDRLKELLHTYDYLLVTTLPATGPTLNQILQAPISNQPQRAGSGYASTEDYRVQPSRRTMSQSQSGSVPEYATMTITDALKQVQEVGEQLITSEKIILKSFPEPVRPSLKNWLADYTFTLGHDRKSPMERGNYLFQGNNAKKLPSGERQKLAYILKAYDENIPVSINKETKQITFIAVESPAQRPPVQPIASQNTQNVRTAQQSHGRQNLDANSIHGNSGIKFSSPQKLPYEKLKSQPYNVKPVFSGNRPDQNGNNDRLMGANVVNLKGDR